MSWKDKSNDEIRRLYGLAEEAEVPAPAELAARLIIAYLDRDTKDSQWYEQTDAIKPSSANGRTIVYSCHTGFLAHTGRAIMVAQELEQLGAHVVFLVDTELPYASAIADAGFPDSRIYHCHAEADEKLIMKKAQGEASWGFYREDMIGRETDAQVAILKRIESETGKLSAIITDLSPVMSISAARLDIQLISVLNCTWTNYFTRVWRPPHQHPVARFLYSAKLGWFVAWLFRRVWLIHLIYQLCLIYWAIPYNKVRRRMTAREGKRLKRVRTFYDQMAGDLILMPDYALLKGMQTNSHVLPIGPLIWEPNENNVLSGIDPKQREAFEQFIEAPVDEPLIYVTLGSSGTLELFEIIIKALAHRPYRVAITTGNQFPLRALLERLPGGVLPENVLAIPLYPGSVVLRKAALTINHGGSGSKYQAMKAGVPEICIPTHPEQQWNTDAMPEEKIAHYIPYRALTESSLLASVRSLMACSLSRADGLHNLT